MIIVYPTLVMSELVFVRMFLSLGTNLTNTNQVTGASGFLGSHITLQLLEKGYRVRA